MASVPFYAESNRLSSSSASVPLPSLKIRSRSTTQMCLEKILEIISSHPQDSLPGSTNLPFQHSETEAEAGKAARSGSCDRIEIDLNLRLGPVSEDPTAEERGSSACSGIGKSDGCNSFRESGEVTTVEKSSQGECDPKTENTEENEEADQRVRTSRDSKEEENRVDVPQNGEESDSNPIVSPLKEEEREKKAESRNEGYLDLLLEAVRQISGEFEDEPGSKEPEARPGPARCCRSKRKSCCCWMIDFYAGFEDTAPVVRSKRGRNQVLPSRYRDSVLEPWKRLARQK